ncbi:MAG TPA: hypothetical protein VK194_00820, partial [Candidatus Deferrimicrobium sp.]|nr:hypothetical protein [Candidatus Deferrimicrobium sp.]
MTSATAADAPLRPDDPDQVRPDGPGLDHPEAAPLRDDASWDAFVAAGRPGSYLQLSGWARVKAVNGWTRAR